MENVAPQTTQSSLSKINNWFKNSIMVKLASIGFLMLMLMIPTSMIESLIWEREMRSNDVMNEVSSGWGRAQTITGPMLTIPYNSYYRDKDDKLRYIVKYAQFLPNDLNFEGAVEPEIRYRGLYKVVLYNSTLKITGNFPQPSFKDWGVPPENIKWNEARISIGITDMRGIQESIEMDWNGKSFVFNPGIENNADLNSGVSTNVDLSGSDSTNTQYNFSLNLDINGSRSLNFVPLGKETNVAINSSWGSPSFDGSFLPDTREIAKDGSGFTANWKVLHLNRNFPQKWIDDAKNIGSASFGVRFLFPVDHYQKSMRSAKYANMFLFLTFLIFFFVEIINKTRIHPIQYLLVGFGLSIFYALLISLSEHISFDAAYLIGSAAIIALITGYSHTIFNNAKLTALMGTVLVALYIFLFSILQMEDYSLLLGSLGLFIVLAIVMYLSRKFKWYGGNEEDGTVREHFDSAQ
ncbi:MAG: cell envelope integrity protein CreD [Flavobacteriales bacterium]|nr:cell envelope integrity protein CreD [Flavobacteriales bacterium]